MRQSYSTEHAQAPANFPLSLWVYKVGSNGSNTKSASRASTVSSRLGCRRISFLNARLKEEVKTSVLTALARSLSAQPFPEIHRLPDNLPLPEQ
jgi:hypothetical protein